MPAWVQMIITIVVTIIASSGFWTYVMHRIDRKNVQTEMLIGLGHDRIMYLGTCYLNRGWITADEYENLYTYLYAPYEKIGGNGSASRIMDAVKHLPIKNVETGGGS